MKTLPIDIVEKIEKCAEAFNQGNLLQDEITEWVNGVDNFDDTLSERFFEHVELENKPEKFIALLEARLAER